MKKIILLASALMFATAAHAEKTVPVPSGKYNMDPTHASLTFKINHLGLSNYTARFTKFNIDLDLNVEDPTQSTVSATVDPNSVRTDFPGEKDFDGEIARNAKFFNSGEFENVTFQSTSVEMTGDDTAKISGDLTMLGQTLPVTLDATLVGALEAHPFVGAPAVGFSATGTFERSNWGMTHLVPNVGDAVTVIIEAEFIKAQ